MKVIISHMLGGNIVN
jgi:hypothetical protein